MVRLIVVAVKLQYFKQNGGTLEVIQPDKGFKYSFWPRAHIGIG